MHIIPASKGCLISLVNQTFFFAFSFLFSFVREHNTMSSSSFCFLKCFMMALLPCPTVLTHMPSLAAMVVHSIELSIFIFISFCFLIIFYFFVFIFRAPFVTSLQPYLPHFLHHCYSACCMHPKLFLFPLSPLSILYFLYL